MPMSKMGYGNLSMLVVEGSASMASFDGVED